MQIEFLTKNQIIETLTETLSSQDNVQVNLGTAQIENSKYQSYWVSILIQN